MQTLQCLRTEVRDDFNIHGTKYFQDAVFYQKSKIQDFFKHPEAFVEVSTSIFNNKKKIEKKKKSWKIFDFEFLNFSFVPMGSGISGIDTSNN